MVSQTGGVMVCAGESKATAAKKVGAGMSGQKTSIPIRTRPLPGTQQKTTQAAQTGQTGGGGYFSTIPGFEPNPKANIKTEFRRLAKFMHWEPGTSEWYHNRGKCYESEFVNWYGTDTSKLDIWKSLCLEVGYQGKSLSSITQCRKFLKTVHVNLVDLIDSRRKGTKVRVFNSLAALREYTKKKCKAFPRELAKAEGFIRVFLRFM